MAKFIGWPTAIAQNVVGSVVWSALLVVFGAVVVGLAALTPIIAYFAPLSYLLAPLVALLLLLGVLNLGMALWRRFRPASSDPALPGAAADELEEKIKAALADSLGTQRALTERVEKLETTGKAIINDYQRMLGLEGRTEENFKKIKGEIARAQHDLGALFAHRSLDGDQVNALVLGIRCSIAAIFHRERLHFLGEHIESVANELSAPTNKSAHYNQDEWKAWEAREKDWLGVVSTWCALAENYVPGITANVMMTTDEHYKQKGVAQVDQFPDPEAFFSYKAFCAVVKNFKNWQGEAQRAVHQAAFNGGGRTPMAGGGDMEELGGKT